MYGEKTGLLGRPEGKGQPGRPNGTLKHYIKINVTLMDWEVIVCVGFIWLRIGTSGGVL
jgi:hypothetical protein